MFSHNFMICDKLTNHPVQIIQARCLSEADIDLMRSEISYCKVTGIDKRDFYSVKNANERKRRTRTRGEYENFFVSRSRRKRDNAETIRSPTT